MQSVFQSRFTALAHVGGLLPAAAAVVLWSLAPVLADLATRIPALQLTAMCLGVAALATWPATRIGWGRTRTRMPLGIAVFGPCSCSARSDSISSRCAGRRRRRRP